MADLEKIYQRFDYQPRGEKAVDSLREDIKNHLREDIIRSVRSSVERYLSNAGFSNIEYDEFIKKLEEITDIDKEIYKAIDTNLNEFIKDAVKEFKNIDFEKDYYFSFDFSNEDYYYYPSYVQEKIEEREREWDEAIKFFPAVIDAITQIKPEGWEEVIDNLVKTYEDKEKRSSWHALFVDHIFKSFKTRTSLLLEREGKVYVGFKIALNHVFDHYLNDVKKYVKERESDIFKTMTKSVINRVMDNSYLITKDQQAMQLFIEKISQDMKGKMKDVIFDVAIEAAKFDLRYSYEDTTIDVNEFIDREITERIYSLAKEYSKDEQKVNEIRQMLYNYQPQMQPGM